MFRQKHKAHYASDMQISTNCIAANWHVCFIGSWDGDLGRTAKVRYSRTPLIRPPSESHWCGRIRGMVAREGFVYEQKPLSVTRNVVVWEGWSLVRVVVRQGFYCIAICKNMIRRRMKISTAEKSCENFPDILVFVKLWGKARRNHSTLYHRIHW